MPCRVKGLRKHASSSIISLRRLLKCSLSPVQVVVHVTETVQVMSWQRVIAQLSQILCSQVLSTISCHSVLACRRQKGPLHILGLRSTKISPYLLKHRGKPAAFSEPSWMCQSWLGFTKFVPCAKAVGAFLKRPGFTHDPQNWARQRSNQSHSGSARKEFLLVKHHSEVGMQLKCCAWCLSTPITR